MKRIIILFFLCCTIPLIAQHTDPIQEIHRFQKEADTPIQEAMANYDYETALSLIAQKKTTPPLLLQKGKALRGLGLTTEALATYQEIICNDTTNTRAFIEAAECCRALAKYNQALKYDEKALECYKTAGDKIKEYENKSKKCEDLINKCNSKLNNCMTSCVQPEQTKKSCGCNIYDKKQVNNCGCTSKAETYGCQSCEEEIIQVAPEQQQNTIQSNNCGCMCETEYEYSYVNPMYDMTPMQYMGNMSNQYMTMETPYIMPFDDGDSMNDMWNNYYMYIQKMIQSMND